MKKKLRKDLEKIARKVAPKITKKEFRKYLTPQTFENKGEVLRKLYNEVNNNPDIKALYIADVISRFKDPIDICVIPEVYEAMIDYKDEHSKNQQRQLAVSCKVIKTILMNCLNGINK